MVEAKKDYDPITRFCIDSKLLDEDTLEDS